MNHRSGVAASGLEESSNAKFPVLEILSGNDVSTLRNGHEDTLGDVSIVSASTLALKEMIELALGDFAVVAPVQSSKDAFSGTGIKEKLSDILRASDFGLSLESERGGDSGESKELHLLFKFLFNSRTRKSAYKSRL